MATVTAYIRLDKACDKAKRRFKGGRRTIRAARNLSKEEMNRQILELAREKNEAFERRDRVMNELLRLDRVTINSFKEFSIVVHLKIHHNWMVRVSLSGRAAVKRPQIERVARLRGIPLEAMATFMGSKIIGIGGKLVNVVYIEGVTGVSTICYDFALKFPAFAKQINDGKGSETNPITMKFKVRLPFLEWVENCWTMHNNLKSGGVTNTELSCAIHDETKEHTAAEIESFIAALEELEHPLAKELKNEMVHRKAGCNWDRLALGSGPSGTSTSGQ